MKTGKAEVLYDWLASVRGDQQMILNMFVLALVALSLWGIKPVKSATELNQNYLSLKTTNALRGIFALVVTFHHVSKGTISIYPYSEFVDMGYLAVAFFFFVSGYGLQKKHITDPSYQNKFLLKRLPPVLLLPILMLSFYFVAALVNGDSLTVKDILLSVFDNHPVVSGSWYVINISIFYVVFYLFMKLFKQHHFAMVVGAVVFYVVWAFSCFRLSHGLWWYSATHLLAVGMFWAVYEKQILAVLKKCYYFVALLFWVTFLIVFSFRNQIITLPIPFILSLIRIVTAVIFVIGIWLFTMKFQIGNRVLAFLGKISYEIFLSHCFFHIFFKSEAVNIENDILYMAAVLVSTIVSSVLLNKVTSALLKKYNALLKKKAI